MTIDWGAVYMQERKRPGHVINGRSIPKVYGSDSQRRDAAPPRRKKKKAA